MKVTLKPKVFVAMSGGVDSSVAATLLKQEGYDVTGVHMLCWNGCNNNEDKQDAMRVAALLDIPFLVWDFRKEYRKSVYDYMIREYQAGRTPNPDVVCNYKIKFGAFLKRTLKAGADFVATGHYVRLENASFHRTTIKSISDPQKLFQAKDQSKDQSYFLWMLTQEQLKYCLFPIGDYFKSEVRALAQKFSLPTATKKDSQGLCFVGKVDFGAFLRSALPVTPGNIITTAGNIIGKHDGVPFYTVGQRHGVHQGGSTKPLYIAGKEISTNTLVVAGGEDPALYHTDVLAENLHWISSAAPQFPLACEARIRYRQALQQCRIFKNGKIIFEKPQRAVSPGQSIVFYKKTEMLGGGIII